MNAPTLLKKLLNRVFASGCNVDESQFKKVSHKIDQSNGDQVVLIEFRYRVKGSMPVSQNFGKEKINEECITFPVLSQLNKFLVDPNISLD